MSKMILFLSILTMAWAAKADTGVAGAWTGWGIWTYGNSGINCNMELQFDENAQHFERLGGAFDCNVLALYSDPLKWEKHEGQLVLEGTASGVYQDGYVQMTEPVNDNTTSTTTIHVTGDKATYTEVWAQGEKVVYKIEGNLKRKKK